MRLDALVKGLITGGHVHGSMRGANRIKVFNLDTGEEVKYVREVNVAQGWLDRAVTCEDGRFLRSPEGEGLRIERLQGRFELRDALGEGVASFGNSGSARGRDDG